MVVTGAVVELTNAVNRDKVRMRAAQNRQSANSCCRVGNESVTLRIWLTIFLRVRSSRDNGSRPTGAVDCPPDAWKSVHDLFQSMDDFGMS